MAKILKQASDRLTTGITYLLHTPEDTKEPKNYHPVTCLSTVYMLTRILPEESHYIWKNVAYCQHSEKDVTLEVKDARIN